MKENHFLNTASNDLNNWNFDEINEIIPKNDPTDFFEDEELILNMQNVNINNQNINTSAHLENNKKSHSSSIKTNATLGEISQKGNEDLSFLSFQNQNINIVEKRKELSKESIEMLSNIINKEKNLISNVNIFGEENNMKNYLSIKDIKNNLFMLDNKLGSYFKRPYMRKNIKNKKNIIINKYDDEQDEDEKIKFDEDDIKMKDIRDDDSKTNNDSCEEINTEFDRKKINLNKIKDS
jgi:predicted type IV restriction endonuclease